MSTGDVEDVAAVGVWVSTASEPPDARPSAPFSPTSGMWAWLSRLYHRVRRSSAQPTSARLIWAPVWTEKTGQGSEL